MVLLCVNDVTVVTFIKSVLYRSELAALEKVFQEFTSTLMSTKIGS